MHEDAERDTDEHRRQQSDPGQFQMAQRVRNEVTASTALLHARHDQPLVHEKSLGNLTETESLDGDGGIELPHAPLVDAPRQAAERSHGGSRQIRSGERHCDVGREEAPVIFEHDEPVALQITVGRVRIRRVDTAARDGLIGEAVVSPRSAADQGRRQLGGRASHRHAPGTRC